MRPATQKPDSNTLEFRQVLKELQRRNWLRYIEPPSGFGCDYVLFLHARVIFIEVKLPAKKNRLTALEVALMEICKWAGVEYHVFTDAEQLLEMIGG